jgi:hypothetical protein
VTPPILPPDLLKRCARALASSPTDQPAIDRRSLELLLASALIGPVACDEYVAAIREASPVGGPSGVVVSDLPLGPVLQDGLRVLSDEQLFRLARSEAAIRELNRLVDEALASGSAGAFWQEAEFLPDEAIPSDYHAAAAHAVEEVRRLERETRPSEPTLPAGGNRRDKRYPRWLTFAVPIGVAASLLLAFFLGRQWPASDGTREVRLASVTVRGEVTRGIEDVAIDVTNGSDRRVFLTFVGLVPGRKTPAYHYRQEGRYVEVPPRGTTAVANLPPEFEGTTVLLVFSTPVPAGGVIREVTPAGVSPESADRDAERIKKALADLSIDSDVKVVTIPIAKR